MWAVSVNNGQRTYIVDALTAAVAAAVADQAWQADPSITGKRRERGIYDIRVRAAKFGEVRYAEVITGGSAPDREAEVEQLKAALIETADSWASVIEMAADRAAEVEQLKAALREISKTPCDCGCGAVGIAWTALRLTEHGDDAFSDWAHGGGIACARERDELGSRNARP